MALLTSTGGRPKAPGLRWRQRRGGEIPCWFPSKEATARKYPGGYVNLESFGTWSAGAFTGSAAALIERCDNLQGQMDLWLEGHRRDALIFDGTVASMLTIYERHPESPFNTTLKPSTLVPYASY